MQKNGKSHRIDKTEGNNSSSPSLNSRLFLCEENFNKRSSSEHNSQQSSETAFPLDASVPIERNSRWRYSSSSSVDSVFEPNEEPKCELRSSAKYHHRPQNRPTSSFSRDPYFSTRPIILSRSHLDGARYSNSSSDVFIPLNIHQSRLAVEAVRAPRIYRVCSQGREWTSNHWNKVKNIEEESDRSRRCSRLSSGFAPIMLFGGLVFICIGISASTNTGKDKAKLKNLSTGPLAVGVIMMIFAILLIALWLYCRARARGLDHILLHGSRKNSRASRNIISTVVSRIQNSDVGSAFPTRCYSSADCSSISMQNKLLSQSSHSNLFQAS